VTTVHAGADDQLDLTIVIPAFKEAAKIERDIEAAHHFLSSRQMRAEIIVVDDGSPDDTTERALRYAGSIPNLRVLRYLPNRGKGHALKYGIARARGRIVMFADAGLCVPYEVADLGLLLLELDMCDVAHGSRRMRGSILRAQPLLRRIGSTGFGFLIHTLMGVPGYISDTQCGFKFYRREVAQKLYAELVCNGMMFDIELVLLALRHRYRILEFPVLWSNDPDSRYDPIRGGALGTLRELFDIKTRLMGLRERKLSQPIVEAPNATTIAVEQRA
jgi:glycosyltransferase involved in cell wall biosynthesis